MTDSQHLGLSAAELEATGSFWTAREIEQQPRMLLQTHALVAALQAEVTDFAGEITGNAGARVILTGAGSSAYIGQCLAPLLDRLLPARVDAVPTTDIVSAPELYLDPAQPLLLVSFGRSGNSPESLAAVALVEALVDTASHLVITCNSAGALVRAPARRLMTLQLPEETHDLSFAMTSSFSCMMYATLAALAGTSTLAQRIEVISSAMRQAIETSNDYLRELAGRGHGRVAYLGSGLLQGVAREAALKLGELSNGAIVTCYDTPMGFRHGPKTFLDADTLVFVFVSNNALTRRYDLDLLEELRNDGVAARIIEIGAVTSTPDARSGIALPELQQAADVELLWPCVAIAQLFAFHCSRALGLAPDRPNKQGTVNRVVQGVRLHGVP